MNQDIRDIRPPVDFPNDYFWLFFIIAFFLGLAFIYFIRLYLKKRKLDEKNSLASPSSWEIAFEQLQKLKDENFAAQGLFKQYYWSLSQILRRYIEERFNIRAPEMTTEEFLRSLDQSQLIPVSQKEILKNFLLSCDLIKFAKHIPLREEAEKAWEIVREFVEETKILDQRI